MNEITLDKDTFLSPTFLPVPYDKQLPTYS